MLQQVKVEVFAANPDGQSSIPRTHKIEGETCLSLGAVP